MSNEKFQNKYRIKSARATWHDYGNGAYFITVCTKKHEHFFGEIIDDVVETRRATSLRMTEIGQFLYDNLQNATAHYPYAEIPLFAVMPNHWHAIVMIDGDKTPYDHGNSTVETRHATSLQSQQTKNEQMQNIANQQSWLSVAIGGIKSAVTKFAHKNNMDFAWQTRFHDHIIRDHDEMNRIADYIENNIGKWNFDCYNKNNNTTVETRRATSLQNATSHQKSVYETRHATSLQNDKQ